MAIRVAEIRDRHPRHQKTLQHAVLDRHYALRRNALVIEIVRPRQTDPVQFFQCRIVRHAQKFRQNFLVYLFCKRLALALILLAMAFEPVAEYFVEENSGARPESIAGPA